MKIASILIMTIFASIAGPAIGQQSIYGAWHQQEHSIRTILILQPGYFTVTEFDTANKKFIQSWGGTSTKDNSDLTATIEFHSADKEQVGRKINFETARQNDLLSCNILSDKKEWKVTDNNQGILPGVWVITGREQNGQMNTIVPGQRKTIKILTGTRFQWVALNTATAEFFGTGGGTYTLNNGIYTERIEFFSRDSTRVGQGLGFQASVKANKWEHMGKSSKGDPVHEIWTKLP